MLELLKARGAQYPAEHNVGHLYEAPESLQQFYRQNDPTNSMNPGIGKTSKQKYWGEAAPTPASPADPQQSTAGLFSLALLYYAARRRMFLRQIQERRHARRGPVTRQ